MKPGVGKGPWRVTRYPSGAEPVGLCPGEGGGGGRGRREGGVPGPLTNPVPTCSSLPSERSATCRLGRARAALGWFRPSPGDGGGLASSAARARSGRRRRGSERPGYGSGAQPRAHLPLAQPSSSGRPRRCGDPFSGPSPGLRGLGARGRSRHADSPGRVNHPPPGPAGFPRLVRPPFSAPLPPPPRSRAFQQGLAVHAFRTSGSRGGAAATSRWIPNWLRH